MRPRALLDVAASAAKVAARRARVGPRRPSWSFQLEVLVEGMRAARRRHEQLPIEAQRRAWDEMALPSPAVRATRRAPTDAYAVPSTWIHAAGRSEGGPVLLYLHGGAYNFGSLATYGDLVSRIALASGARVLFPDYRLAPEHPFPGALEDAFAVYARLVREVDPARLVIAGDSAGGGLATATLIRARDEGLPLPRAAVLVCPWVSLVDENHDEDPDDWVTGAWASSFGDAYRAGVSREDPRLSPARADLRGLPPMLVQAGSAELLHPQIEVFAASLTSAGVEVELEIARDMVHDWHFFATVYPPARAAFDSIGRFVRARTTATAPPVRAPAIAPGAGDEAVDRGGSLVHI